MQSKGAEKWFQVKEIFAQCFHEYDYVYQVVEQLQMMHASGNIWRTKITLWKRWFWHSDLVPATASYKLYRSIFILLAYKLTKHFFFFDNHNSVTQQAKITARIFNLNIFFLFLLQVFMISRLTNAHLYVQSSTQTYRRTD